MIWRKWKKKKTYSITLHLLLFVWSASTAHRIPLLQVVFGEYIKAAIGTSNESSSKWTHVSVWRWVPLPSNWRVLVYLPQSKWFILLLLHQDVSFCMPFCMLSALSLHYLCIFSASFSLQKLLASMFPSLFILSLYQTTT